MTETEQNRQSNAVPSVFNVVASDNKYEVDFAKSLDNAPVTKLSELAAGSTSGVQDAEVRSLEQYVVEYGHRSEPQVISFRDQCPWIRGADRYTHLIHRYTAKLLPHIPAFFMASSICPSNATILDPFAGSGTVLLEGMLQGHQVLGVEINPIARLIAKVKTTVFNTKALEEAAKAITRSISSSTYDAGIPDFPNRDLWFSKKVQKGLAKVKAAIETFQDDSLKDFFWVCYSSLVRRVALADPRISPPVVLKPEKFDSNSLRHSKVSQMLEERTNANVEALFASTLGEFIKRFRRLEETLRERELGSAEVVWDDARDLRIAPMKEKGLLDKASAKEFPADSVDLVITSPPYMNAQKYARSLRLEWYWLGLGSYDELHAMDASMIGTERLTRDEYEHLKTVGHAVADELILNVFSRDKHRARLMANYFEDMRICFANLFRVIKPGGHLVIVVGDNRVFTYRIPNHQILTDLATQEGFRPKLVVVDEIKSRGLMTKRNTTADVIPAEWIIVLRKFGTTERGKV